MVIASLLEGRLWDNRSILGERARFGKATHEMRILSCWLKLKFAEHKGTLCLNDVGNVQTKENVSPGVYKMFLSRHIGLW